MRTGWGRRKGAHASGWSETRNPSLAANRVVRDREGSASAMTSHEYPNQSPAANLSAEEREQLRERVRFLNSSRLARRQFLQVSGAVSLGALLAACGGSNTANTPTTAAPTANINAPVPTAPPNTGAQATAPASSAAAATRPAGSAARARRHDHREWQCGGGQPADDRQVAGHHRSAPNLYRHADGQHGYAEHHPRRGLQRFEPRRPVFVLALYIRVRSARLDR